MIQRPVNARGMTSYDDDAEDYANGGRIGSSSKSSFNVESSRINSVTQRGIGDDGNDEYDEKDHLITSKNYLGSPVKLRVIFISTILCIIGVVFLISGLYVKSQGEDYSLPFFIICGITLTPGFYSMVVIIGAWCGLPGWQASADALPQFEDIC